MVIPQDKPRQYRQRFARNVQREIREREHLLDATR